MITLPVLVVLTIGVVLVVFGFRQRVSLLKKGIRAEGTIIALETEGLRLLDVYPTVRFVTSEGKWLTLRSQTSGRAQNWKVGQRVEVRYPAAVPEEFTVVSGLDFLIG